MRRSYFIPIILIAAISFALAPGCAKDDTHWGQKLDVKKKWWKKEGQSWDRESNVFMAVGYSNPNWKDKYDMRKSADLDARSQVASFMASLVKNYMEEIRSRNFSISESTVEASANETVLGSVIVARKYKAKRYMSLVKVDTGYFFAQIYKKYRSDMEAKIRRGNPRADPGELDSLIQAKVDSSLAKVKELEAPAVEKSLAATAPAEEVPDEQ